MKLDKAIIEQMERDLAKVKTLDDMLGKNGLVKNLIKALSEQILEEELSAHLGYEKYDSKGHGSGNNRNGSSQKQLKSDFGAINVDIPRDRNGEFEPILIQKYQKEFGELDSKIISMYAKGMSTRDIQAHLEDIYGLSVSPAFISRITERVMERVSEWQSRPLEEVYVIVYFDAIHYKVKEDHTIKTKAAYTCLGVDTGGHRDVLGIWIDEAEGANFWLSIISELKNRGVKDILIACVDGLKGFPEAIQSVFPQTQVQLCVIHQIRNSLRYVAYKHKKEFMKDLKRVYQASTKTMAEKELNHLREKWYDRYPIVIKSWENRWDNLSIYFSYTPEIRKLIYTTNSVEALHRQFRKVTKSKTIFPNDKALEKMLFLAYYDLTKKWKTALRDWTKIISQLAIAFEGRLDLNL